MVLMSLLTICFAEHKDIKPNTSKGVSLCHNNPLIEDENLSLKFGFLYQKPFVTGTGYAHTNNTTTTWTPPQNGSTLSPQFDLQWGVVFGAGYYFQHDHWVAKLNFNYLSLGSTECDDCNCDDSPYYIPDCIWCHDLIPPLLNHLDPAYTDDVPFVNMCVKYYMLQETLSRGSYLSKNMSFEPSFGVKSVWLEFYQKVCFTNVQSYNNCCSNQRQALQPYSAKLVREAKSEFWGVGPSIGLDTTWNLFGMDQPCCKLYNFFADFEAALLLGRTKSSELLEVSVAPTINLSNDYSLMSPTLRAVIGLSFDKEFNDNQYYLSSRIGWDNCIYFNQFTTNCFRGVCGLKTNENNTFSLTGLIVDFTISF